MAERQWANDKLFALSREVRDLYLGDAVERVAGPLTPLQFYRDFVAMNKPCIITGAVDHWPALHRWSNQYLRERVGDSVVTVDVTPDGYGDSIAWREEATGRYAGRGHVAPCCLDGQGAHLPQRDSNDQQRQPQQQPPIQQQNRPPGHRQQRQPDSLCARGCHRQYFVTPDERRMTFGSFLDLFEQSRAHPQQGVPYVQHQNGSFLEEFPQLVDDADSHIEWASEALGGRPDAVNMWVGDARATTSFHKDHYENLYVVVAGEKIFTLLPPCDVHRMYVREYKSGRFHQRPAASTDEGGKSDVKDGAFEILIDESLPDSQGGGSDDEEKAECHTGEGERAASPSPPVPWVSVDPKDPDATRFPRYFCEPPPLTCVVKAGEMLFLPSLFYHHVAQREDAAGRCIALNFWYDMTYDSKYAYFNLVNSICPEGTPTYEESEPGGDE
eukprot:jgi/Mesvir1/1010/Mv17544-RA.1